MLYQSPAMHVTSHVDSDHDTIEASPSSSHSQSLGPVLASASSPQNSFDAAKIMLVCLSVEYCADELCLSYLRQARAAGKKIALILFDELKTDWPSTEVSYLCQLHAPYTIKCDLSTISKHESWLL